MTTGDVLKALADGKRLECNEWTFKGDHYIYLKDSTIMYKGSYTESRADACLRYSGLGGVGSATWKIWEDPKLAKKMTVAEIEAKLGYKVEVVS